MSRFTILFRASVKFTMLFLVQGVGIEQTPTSSLFSGVSNLEI